MEQVILQEKRIMDVYLFDREINLLYEDIKLIFGDIFNDELLRLSFSGKNKNRKIITDDLTPILFTKTLLQYYTIISLKEEIGRIIDNDVLEEYCSYVADGFYFELNKIIDDLKTWSSLENIATLSSEYLQRKIYTKIFIDNWSIPYHSYDLFPEEKFYSNEIEAVSAYVYFEISKNKFTEENYKNTKESFFEQYKGFLDEVSFCALWNTLKSFESASLFEIIKTKAKEFKNNSALISDYLEKIRGILSTLIPFILNNDYLAFYHLLWIKMTEVRLDKKLHKKIIQEIAADNSL